MFIYNTLGPIETKGTMYYIMPMTYFKKLDFKDAVARAYGALLGCDRKLSKTNKGDVSGDISHESKQSCIKSSSDSYPDIWLWVQTIFVVEED